MKAVAYRQALPITEKDALLDVELPMPDTVQGHDLLIQVRAVSVNPVDTKVRQGRPPADGQAEVLGWDAAGVVVATGPDCTLFRVGDEVFYAGAINRPGSNAEFQRVDERIVGRKPHSLGFAEAAALPLTSITAWELLFDRFALPARTTTTGHLLVVGGAGGVGSMAIQLAKQLTGLVVIATASRPESRDWCGQLGADHVIDHREPLLPQLQTLGITQVEYVFSLTATDQHFAALVELMAPQGRLGLIDDPATLLDVRLLKRKSLSLHWEMMFARPLFQTADLQAQHQLLNEVSALVDAGRVRSTLNAHFGSINAANMKKAHALIESGKAVGKVVLEGFA